eukprot:497748-Rhodomonas_salina.4
MTSDWQSPRGARGRDWGDQPTGSNSIDLQIVGKEMRVGSVSIPLLGSTVAIILSRGCGAFLSPRKPFAPLQFKRFLFAPKSRQRVLLQGLEPQPLGFSARILATTVPQHSLVTAARKRCINIPF